MYSMLNKISGFNQPYIDIDVYNSEFFSEYLDIEKLLDLLEVKSNYTFLCHTLEERYHSELSRQDEHLKKEIAKTDDYIEDMFDELRELEEKRRNLSDELIGLYNSEYYDQDKASFLENEIDNISRDKNQKHFDLNKLISKKDSLLGQKKKNDIYIAKMDKDIENQVDRLKKNMEGIDLGKLNIFGCFENPEIRNKYEEGLARYFPNFKERQLYSDYFYKMVTKEAKFIEDTVKVASEFLKKANKGNGFHVPSLDGRNRQLYNYDFMFGHMSDNITNWLGNTQLPAGPRLIDAYREVEGFVDDMLEYAEEFDKYSNNPTLEGIAYDKLRKEYNRFFVKNENKKPKILGVINKRGVASIESAAYKDLAIDMFDFYVNAMYVGLKERRKARNLNPEEKINPKFKATPKTETHEEKRVETLAAIRTPEEEKGHTM